MDYKSRKNKDKKVEFFIYKPRLIKNERSKINKKISKNNPFGKLSELRFR